MKITSPDTPWSEVSHNPALRKQVFLANGEVPHLTQFARSIFQPGQMCEAHTHADMREIFQVTSGTLTAIVDGQKHELPADSVLTLAPGESHELSNQGPEELHLTYFGLAV
jgi:quercetin dioxygenase-like cupin family protein